MSEWMSAKTVHMCHEVLVTELVGVLGAWIKWMSSSMSSMNFFSFENQKRFLIKIFAAMANSRYPYITCDFKMPNVKAV